MVLGLSKLRKKAVEKLNLEKGDRVLEVACGTGLNFPLLEEKVGKQGKITGVDYVEEMIEASKKLVKRKSFKNITLIKKDAARLNIKEKFDAVLSTVGISAIPDHVSALKQIKKILKKDGTLVVLDGKKFDKPMGFLNFLITLLRWSKSFDPNKEIIKDMKKIFNKVEIEKYFLGSVFIAKVKHEKI